MPLRRLLPGGPPRFVPRGIHNPGILCYRNSLIQSLFHTPKVANWLKFNHAAAGCQVGADCLTCAIRDLLDEYWTFNSRGRQHQRNNAARHLQRLFGRGKLSSRYHGDVINKVLVSSDARQGNSAAVSKHFTQSGNQEDAQELYVYLYDVFDRQLPQ